MTSRGAGDELPPLLITPDRFAPIVYGAAAGDLNPIHIDDAFARSVGLPNRILHGYWTMAQVARAVRLEPDPLALRRLEVQFRAMGVAGRELTVRARIRETGPSSTIVDACVDQQGMPLIRNGVAEITHRPRRG